MMLLLVGGTLIGFLLAALGAGGSILLMPLLVSGAGMSAQEAVPISLLVVALMSIVNLGPYVRRHQVAPRAALVLGIPALAGAWIGGSLVKAGWVSETAQLSIFAAAALAAAWFMIRRDLQEQRPQSKAVQPREPAPALALAGEGVVLGLLTGVAGVGGGFALVPALVLLAGLPMQLASGTSLLLLSVNSLVALVAIGHWSAHGFTTLLWLVGGGLIGAIVGQWLAPRSSERLLRRGFAALVLGSALLTGFEAWRRHDRPPIVLRTAASRQIVLTASRAPSPVSSPSTASVAP
ncbi:sulfite exporter TauE/SafE family protein [Vulcanococcus limneticus]|uniref:sulfite exporter TauE/SafE family protein n=1 Tax=Vulcanococcus limneticus TaxID=2170428 RepID=UPI000B997D24|nr:sulfite exporter TauE/SafE family protein [Vulcanococcus limneticus]MCP9793035.1 sulfite exporter TauE/SafE family protein [Vulcanococcus limneticus MW73D5]MCP9894977.1 sulfite exporter TauE/SafE family protein [Vulcanococcus limneticus Candia 3F8]MCP9898433.1 sulfite exporter TauE/SafE family protein [Vulcanococcus limneticus Candia 3B3]